MFERVKHYYDVGLYTQVNVMAFVAKNYLTMEQYYEIVGTNEDEDEVEENVENVENTEPSEENDEENPSD